jgi:F-type H+-transporting ATPase subunit epsilon
MHTIMSEAATDRMHVELITPLATMVKCEDGRRAYLPTPGGEIGVLPGHTSMICPLTVGRVRVQRPDQVDCFAVSGGLLEVHPDRLLIVAETAERADQIDTSRADAARERAEQRIADARRNEQIDLQRAEGALARAMNRLRVARSADKTDVR